MAGKEGTAKISALAEFHISNEGCPRWVRDQGTIALCWFRDNTIIATNFADKADVHIVHTVCRIPECYWEPAVLCGCRQQQSDQCKHICHCRSYVALAYCLIRGERGGGSTFVQPSALEQRWLLQLGRPLITSMQ